MYLTICAGKFYIHIRADKNIFQKPQQMVIIIILKEEKKMSSLKQYEAPREKACLIILRQASAQSDQ